MLSPASVGLRDTELVCEDRGGARRGGPAGGFRNPEHPFEEQAELCERL
jgi:hypothetical protein